VFAGGGGEMKVEPQNVLICFFHPPPKREEDNKVEEGKGRKGALFEKARKEKRKGKVCTFFLFREHEVQKKRIFD